MAVSRSDLSKPLVGRVRLIGRLMLGVAFAFGCGASTSSPDATPPVDVARTFDAGPDADLLPYFQPCTTGPDTCPAPYACTPFQNQHEPDAAVRFVCLIPCSSGDQCPTNCLCNGVNGGTDVGVDHTCACI